MHSAEQQEAWSLVESMDDRQLKSEVVDLRGEVAALKAELADEAIALRDMMAERDAAEAELDGIRALADRRNKRYHVEDTTHQLVAALDQALDIAQAELATERARLDWLEDNAGDIPKYNSRSFIWSANQNLRAAIDAAMKGGAK
tara:strand:+ start:901 stop:1335 length:435 start_codon:yes stop_codon:yes gene_type:complete